MLAPEVHLDVRLNLFGHELTIAVAFGTGLGYWTRANPERASVAYHRGPLGAVAAG
jgi:hypothetical protein